MRVLPAPLREPIGLAYLLARAADTIADSTALPPAQRLERLIAFRGQVVGPSSPAVLGDIAAGAGSGAAGAEAELLGALAELFGELDRAAEADRDRIREVVVTLTEGMEMDLVSFPAAGSGEVRALEDAEALDRYTYLVAGCVGEFWTRTCAAHAPALSHWHLEEMCRTGVRFGKALQLTNVLRDVPADLRAGRCYIPGDRLEALGLAPADLLDAAASDAARPALTEWMERALGHFGAAREYVLAVPRSERRLRLAALWPVLMGLETLAMLGGRRRWLEPGRPAKVSRRWVYSMMLGSTAACSSDALVRRWIDRASGRVSASL